MANPEKHLPTVEIYPDGTAKEGQSVPAGTLCFWTGFDKTKDTFRGKPKENKQNVEMGK